MVLHNDVKFTKQHNITTKDTVLDLNGKTITNEKDIFVDDTNSLLSIRADSTITGNGTIKAKEGDCYCIDVKNGAKVTIKDGNFIGNASAIQVNEGEVTIEGGFFAERQDTNTDKYMKDGFDRYTLNCIKANYNDGSAKFIVKGGIYENFDPSKCYAEGDTTTNFVAEGYKSVEMSTEDAKKELGSNYKEGCKYYKVQEAEAA